MPGNNGASVGRYIAADLSRIGGCCFCRAILTQIFPGKPDERRLSCLLRINLKIPPMNDAYKIDAPSLDALKSAVEFATVVEEQKH